MRVDGPSYVEVNLDVFVRVVHVDSSHFLAGLSAGGSPIGSQTEVVGAGDASERELTGEDDIHFATGEEHTLGVQLEVHSSGGADHCGSAGDAAESDGCSH